jgi:DNA-directed RNA polymerase subunit RPC12/RpoP
MKGDQKLRKAEGEKTMQPSFPPCPECGGQRAFFKGASPAIRLRLFRSIEVYGYTCLECGHTTLRVHPDDLKILHEAAEKAPGKAPYPCPECKGERIFFTRVGTENPPTLRGIALYAYTCLKCGYTTERPLPKGMAALRKAATNKYSRFF